MFTCNLGLHGFSNRWYIIFSLMITKEAEYVSEVCKIAGFAFIAPFGKETLDIPYTELFNIPNSHLLYMTFTLLLACIGINIIFKGKEILKENKE